MLRRALTGEIDFSETLSDDRIMWPSKEGLHRFEHYDLARDCNGTPIELGRGAMGITYKAIDVHLRCPVALKVISEEHLANKFARLRFLREARAAASVRHQNVASVFHFGRAGETYFYAMEFVDGQTLEHLIKSAGHLEIILALNIVTQVTAGLSAIHKQKLVHRDIKPSNIMVCLEENGDPTAKIIDLGLAKAVAESQSDATISSLGGFAGTPDFASPEHFAGCVDIRSDLYSLGVMLWKMVTGRPPFKGSPAEVMCLHQRAPLPLQQLEEIPPTVISLIEVLLEKDPALRFQTPAELLKVMPSIRSALDEATQSIPKTCGNWPAAICGRYFIECPDGALLRKFA